MRHAVKHMEEQGLNALLCPCSKCQNLKRWRDVTEVELHLFNNRFMKDYDTWIWHGERADRSANVAGENVVGESVENVIFENVDNENVMYENYDNENVENVENENIELDEIMSDVETDCPYIPEILRELFEKESNVPLYPDCTKYSKISAVFHLYNLKATNGWSDKSFTDLLKLLGVRQVSHGKAETATEVAGLRIGLVE